VPLGLGLPSPVHAARRAAGQHFRQRRGISGIGDQRIHREGVERISQGGADEAGIHRHPHQPGLGQREEADDMVRMPGQHQRHTVPRLQTAGQQAVGDAVRRVVHLREGPGAAFKGAKHMARVRFRATRQQLGDGHVVHRRQGDAAVVYRAATQAQKRSSKHLPRHGPGTQAGRPLDMCHEGLRAATDFNIDY
jgi:hypothetical protein